MGKKISAKEFVAEAFDYLNSLTEASVNLSTNRYLLEFIANGFAKYGDTQYDFEKHVDEWIRNLANIYPELGYDHEKHQIKAVIDFVDQLVVVEQDLIDELRYVIDIQKKYGMYISFSSKKCPKQQTTLCQFFEYIERLYPTIKARYKGLGSSNATVSKEVITDPKTRRLVRITMDDAEIMKTMGMLVGDSRENIAARKEMLMNFKLSMDMIDN